MSMKRKLSFDYNENLISGNKIAKTSQGNQTILIGASKGLQVNLRNECLTKSAQTRWVSSSKSIQCSPLQATISVQTSNVSRNIGSQTGETETGHDKNVSKLLNIFNTKTSSNKKKLLDTLLIVCEAFDKVQDSQCEKIIGMFAQNIVKNVPCIGSPSFNLLFDFIRFYNLENTCAMRYSESTKCIFKVAKGLFGGATLRFLSGWKHEMQVLSCTAKRGYFSPAECQALLPVPSERVLDQFQPLQFDIPKRLKPGVYPDFIDIAVKSTPSSSSLVLKFDGRRIRPGFEDDEVGDVDLAGCESSLSLVEQIKKHFEILDIIKTCCEKITDLNDTISLINSIKTVLEIMNRSSFILKEKRASMQKSLTEKMKLAGKDWIHSKYKKIISYLTALIRKSNKVLEKSLSVRDSLSSVLCKLQNSNEFWTDMPFVPLDSIRNCWLLNDNIDHISTNDIHVPVKQRTEKWHTIRNEAYVTGSTLYQAAGLDGLQNRLSLYDKVHFSIKEKSPNEQVCKAMKHGSENEINAIATICTKVLPVYFPHLDYVEVGIFRFPKAKTCHCHVENKCSYSDSQHEFSLFSLDGVFIPHTECLKCLDINQICMSTEVKCPYFKKECHMEVPVRYIPQIQASMAVSNAPISLFVSYTSETTSVFVCKKNEEYFDDLMHHIQDTFIEGSRKLKSSQCFEIKSSTKSIIETCEFLTEVKSIHVTQSTNETDQPESMYKGHVEDLSFFGCKLFTANDIKALLLQCIEILNNTRQIQRVRATESVTYMLSNTDRLATNERGYGIQIGYVLSGSSFPERDARAVVDKFYIETLQRGGNVPAVAFDGQFHRLLAVSNEGKPLTIFQLQKHCWESVKNMSKSEIITYIENIIKSFSKYTAVTKSTSPTVFQVSCPDLVSSNLKCDKSVFSSAPVCADADFSQNEEENLSEESVFDNNVTPAAVDLMDLSDELIQPVDDVESDKVDEVVENDLNSNSVLVSDISLTTDNVSSLQVFLHQNSKLQSLSCKQLCELLQNSDMLYTNATLADLKNIIKWLKTIYRDIEVVKDLKLSGRKHDIVSKLSTILCASELSIEPEKRQKLKNPNSLYCICLKKLKKQKKAFLNVIAAHHMMHDMYDQWKSDSPVSFQIAELPNNFWCSVPELHHKSNALVLHFIDYHHLHIRIRMCLIKGKLQFVSLEGWRHVSQLPDSPLPIPVLNGVDPQSESFAALMFSPPVQMLLKKDGFIKEAQFCQLVRGFMEANDMPGISAMDRHRLRFDLRSYLLQWINVFSFPPPGDNVMGMPFQLFEALISSSDSYLQLHSLIPSGSYNVRAISTNDNETLHGLEEAMLKPFGGVPSVKQLEIVKSKTIEISAILNDPTMNFPIRHAKKPVYSHVNYLSETLHGQGCHNLSLPLFIDKIEIKDHAFDKRERKSTKKVQTISNWWAPPKGVPGIRKLYKTNEMSFTLCERMGYPENESNTN